MEIRGLPCMTRSARVKASFCSKGIKKRPRGGAGVKGAFFAFILTLEAGSATPILASGTKLRGFFSELRSIVEKPSFCIHDQSSRVE